MAATFEIKQGQIVKFLKKISYINVPFPVRKYPKCASVLLPFFLENICYKGLDRLLHLKKLYLTRNRIQVLENLDKNKNLEVRNIYITSLGSQRCPGYWKLLDSRLPARERFYDWTNKQTDKQRWNFIRIDIYRVTHRL